MAVLVTLATATICFLNQCHPILFGKATPVGEFQLQLRLTDSVGYGGDVIQFYEDDTSVMAIHRLWRLSPAQHRDERILSPNPKDHEISGGCINVEPEVYEQLKNCCSNDHLTIR